MILLLPDALRTSETRPFLLGVDTVEPSSAEGVEVEGSGAEFQKLEVLGSILGGLVLSSEEGL